MGSYLNSCTDYCSGLFSSKAENQDPTGKTRKCTVANVAKITLLAVSVLALTVAILAALVNFGVLANSPLSFLGSIGQFGSGALGSAALFGTGIGAYLIFKGCCSKNKDNDEKGYEDLGSSFTTEDPRHLETRAE